MATKSGGGGKGSAGTGGGRASTGKGSTGTGGGKASTGRGGASTGGTSRGGGKGSTGTGGGSAGGSKGGGSYASGGKGSTGGGTTVRALYGVWIDKAVQSNNVSEMKAVLQEARKLFPPIIQPLYGVWIRHCIESGKASRQELEHLLETAKATQNSDLQGAIKTLEKHLGGKK